MPKDLPITAAARSTSRTPRLKPSIRDMMSVWRRSGISTVAISPVSRAADASSTWSSAPDSRNARATSSRNSGLPRALDRIESDRCAGSSGTPSIAATSFPEASDGSSPRVISVVDTGSSSSNPSVGRAVRHISRRAWPTVVAIWVIRSSELRSALCRSSMSTNTGDSSPAERSRSAINSNSRARRASPSRARTTSLSGMVRLSNPLSREAVSPRSGASRSTAASTAAVRSSGSTEASRPRSDSTTGTQGANGLPAVCE